MNVPVAKTKYWLRLTPKGERQPLKHIYKSGYQDGVYAQNKGDQSFQTNK